MAVFCLTAAFRETDIDLTVESVDGSPENVSELCEGELIKYKDANLIFLDVDKIKNQLNALSGYIEVIKVEKTFPNKIVVSVKERVEQYSIIASDKIYALDGNFCVLSQKDSFKNNVTGTDNLLINIPQSDFDVNLSIGNKLNVYDQATSSYLSAGASYLCEIKDCVESVSLTVKKDGIYSRKLTLKMKEGVVFNIFKADEKTVEKLRATYEFYLSLENKGVGEYITVLEDGGNITVKQ